MTKAVMATVAKHHGQITPPSEHPSLAAWRAHQEWLDRQAILSMDPPTFNIAVVIPYADTLSKLMNGGEVRLRRDFSTVLGLIDAHAIIHMMTRRRDKEGRIVATLADYAKVRDLSAEWGIDAAELEAGAAEAAEAAEFLPFVAPF